MSSFRLSRGYRHYHMEQVMSCCLSLPIPSRHFKEDELKRFRSVCVYAMAWVDHSKSIKEDRWNFVAGEVEINREWIHIGYVDVE
jgi:hypothetical protein